VLRDLAWTCSRPPLRSGFGRQPRGTYHPTRCGHRGHRPMLGFLSWRPVHGPHRDEDDRQGTGMTRTPGPACGRAMPHAEESHQGLKWACHRSYCERGYRGAMRETSPQDKEAETVWEVATKEAVEGASHQSGPGRGAQARGRGGRFTSRHGSPVSHEAENSSRALRPMRIAIPVGKHQVPSRDERGRRFYCLSRERGLPVETIPR